MDRRGNIITGVWRVILTRGIAGVSIRAVADAAGVSLGLVQHYFPSKESLIHTSAQAMIDGAAERYESTVPDEEAVRHLVTHAIPTTDGMRDGAVVWHAYLAASVDDEPLARMLREAKSGQEQELAARLQPRMTADEAVRTARIVIALSDGLTARVITGGLTGEEAITAALDTLADLSGIEE